MLDVLSTAHVAIVDTSPSRRNIVIAGEELDRSGPRVSARRRERRRVGRRAKELVKQRLEAGPMIAGSLGTTEDSHIDALLALARGTTLRDRDWALRRLAQLAMEGHPIPELTISRTT